MRRIVGLLQELRQAMREGNKRDAERIKSRLVESNLLHYLHTYQFDLTENVCDSSAGWIYILSTREQPDILKIGMTQRSATQRVKEINSATGVLVPYAARRVFRVLDAAQAEKDIFQLLAHKRIRSDREFFKVTFSEAVSLIQQYLYESKMLKRCHGNVIWYNQEKCYGFISVHGLDDVFLHSSQIPKEILPKVVPGTLLEFDLSRRPQGLCALNICLAENNGGRHRQ